MHSQRSDPESLVVRLGDAARPFATASDREPLVTGEHGRRALELADWISARIAKDRADVFVMPEEYSHQ